jgi:hypothetical protein
VLPPLSPKAGGPRAGRAARITRERGGAGALLAASDWTASSELNVTASQSVDVGARVRGSAIRVAAPAVLLRAGGHLDADALGAPGAAPGAPGAPGGGRFSARGGGSGGGHGGAGWGGPPPPPLLLPLPVSLLYTHSLPP